MLTAGHCAPVNGELMRTIFEHPRLGTMTLGEITFNNWEPGVGTVAFPGQEMMRGDLALAEAWDNRHPTAWIWRFGVNSTEGSAVTVVWNRFSLPDDPYYVSAAETGETGVYSVIAAFVDINYGDGEWVRNAVEGERFGACTAGGDSGGAVFTKLANNRVAAKGVHSGGFSLGPICRTVFTDIVLAVDGLPGSVKTH